MASARKRKASLITNF